MAAEGRDPILCFHEIVSPSSTLLYDQQGYAEWKWEYLRRLCWEATRKNWDQNDSFPMPCSYILFLLSSQSDFASIFARDPSFV